MANSAVIETREVAIHALSGISTKLLIKSTYLKSAPELQLFRFLLLTNKLVSSVFIISYRYLIVRMRHRKLASLLIFFELFLFLGAQCFCNK